MSSSDDLLTQFRHFAKVHGESQLTNSRKANRAFDRLAKVRRSLFVAGPERYREILTLLDDDNVYVRSTAAFDALSIEPERGLKVLREIAAGPPSVENLNATLTLELWDAGTLPLQWWKDDDA